MHKDYNDLDIVTVFKYETSLYVCIYIYSILKCYFKRYYRVNVQHFDFHLNPFFVRVIQFNVDRGPHTD